MGTLLPTKCRKGMSGGPHTPALLLCLVVISCWCVGTEARGYVDGYCYCDLDNFLVDVRKAVIKGEEPPPIPDVTDETASAATTDSSGTSGTGTAETGGSDASTGDSATTGSSAGEASGSGGTNPDSTNAANSDTTNSPDDASDSGQTSTDETTAAPNQGASDSEQTTANSAQTTANPEQTTANPEQTTANPEQTTANPEQTTANPEQTTSDSGQTTAAPGETTVQNTATTTEGATVSTTTNSLEDTTTASTSGGNGNGQAVGRDKDETTTVDPTETTTANETTNATDSPARKRREIDDDEYVVINNDLAEAATLMETPCDFEEYFEEEIESHPRANRVKREGINLVWDLENQAFPLYSPITNKMEYSGLRTSKDLGVQYDNEMNAKNCSCKDGSIVSVKVCLLNLKYESALANENSNKHKEVSNKVLFILNGVLHKGLIAEGGERLFRRVGVKSYDKRDETSTFLVLEVGLTRILYQAEYHVKNAIEPFIRNAPLGPYKTDRKCLITEDVTPPEPVVRSSVWWLRYTCIPIAIGIAILMIFLTCVGKRDAYSVGKW